jgi:hypothetical protein
VPELKRIRSYFKERPSAGYIAWLLWRGEPGRQWAERELEKLRF